MTVKNIGSTGVEFPDASVQASAAYTKAESGAEFAPALPPRTWKSVTRVMGTAYVNDTGQEIILRSRLSLPGAGTTLQCTINGLLLLGGSISVGTSGVDQWTIPAGATYTPNLSTGTTGTVTHFEYRP